MSFKEDEDKLCLLNDVNCAVKYLILHCIFSRSPAECLCGWI